MAYAAPGGAINTRLITSKREAPALTCNAESGSLTAVRRGLAEYLMWASGQEELSATGRALGLKGAYWDWAEWEDERVLPAALVGLDGEAEYDPSGFTPNLDTAVLLDSVSREGLLCVSQLSATLQVTLWLHDPVARGALGGWLEKVLYPVSWSSAFKLGLDHYYGTFATYLLQGVEYADSGEGSRVGTREVRVRVHVDCPVLRKVTLPAAANIRTEIEVLVERGG